MIGKACASLCGRGISAIDDVDDRALVQLADGEAVEADLVIIGIGVQPNTVLAEAAGLAIENGIAVDDRLRTSDPVDLRCRRLLLFPAAALRWTTGAARGLAHAPRSRGRLRR